MPVRRLTSPSPLHPSVYTIERAYVTNPPAVYGMEFHYKFF